MKRLYRKMIASALVVAMLAALPISTNATELKTSIGIVEAGSGLRLRAKPNTDADILSTASYGDNVVIIRQVGDWYLVNYNLDIGYMHGEYLEVKERENVDLGYGSIDPSLCNMRSGPSTSAELVDQLSAGEKVFIFGFNCGWYKVEYNDQIGYIRSDLVTLLEKPYANSGSTGGSYVEEEEEDSSDDSYVDDYDYDEDDSSSYDEDDSSYSYDDSSSSLGQQVADYAMQYLGCDYVYGGNGPYSFDCSGFVKYIYEQFGYSINRTATDQYENGYWVSMDDLQPGDLVFFSAGDYMGHVGMYIGNNEFIHAANASKGVCITDLDEYWYAVRYAGARRIV